MITRFKSRAALPSKSEERDITDDPSESAVTRGQLAWARRKKDAHASWHDWLLIGFALLEGRDHAWRKANRKLAGTRYNEALDGWLKMHGFADISKQDRQKLIAIMEDLPLIKMWRDDMTEDQRLSLNHPHSVWRAWMCGDRGVKWRIENSHAKDGDDKRRQKALERKAKSGGNVAQITTPAQADDDENQRAERQDNMDWQSKLFYRAQKAIDQADLHDVWLLDPPDDGLIDTVRLAAKAWAETATILEQLAKPKIQVERRKSQNADRVLEDVD
jgi:hypothetical protein